MQTFLFASSGQAIPPRKPDLAGVGAVTCTQIGSRCVLICHSELKGGLGVFIFMSNPFQVLFICSELKECQGLVNNCLLNIYKRHRGCDIFDKLG